MDRNVFRLGTVCFVVAGCLVAGVSHAQDLEPEDASEEAPAKTKTDDEGSAEAASSSAAKDKDAAAKDESGSDSAVELPGKTYRFVGARYRGIVVPKFMQNLFAEGGRTVYVHAFGPEFAIRKDGFEYNLSAWLGLYNMDDTAFKGKTDPEEAWELVNAKMQILYLTSDFLWSHEFSPEVALNYGVGAGLGFVFGDLIRAQSHPNPAVPGQDPNDYIKCTGQNDPTGFVNGRNYCDGTEHYGTPEPSWANGGSKPILFPWLALQTGVRFKPTKSFAGRLDLGFGTSGFFFGLGGDYGL